MDHSKRPGDNMEQNGAAPDAKKSKSDEVQHSSFTNGISQNNSRIKTPFRVPIARLAAAHASVEKHKKEKQAMHEDSIRWKQKKRKEEYFGIFGALAYWFLESAWISWESSKKPIFPIYRMTEVKTNIIRSPVR